MRWRPSCTPSSTSRSSTGSTTTSERWAPRRSSTCASRTPFSSRSGAELPLERGDHDGRGLRRRRPRPLLRPGRRVAGRGREPSDAGGRCGRDGTSCHAATRRRSRTPGRALPGSGARRPGALRARAVRRVPPIDGVAADSTTETYAALRLEIENWRWAGVPFFIRTGKRLPVTQTELRLVFRRPPRLGFAFDEVVEPNQLVIKLDPSTGRPAPDRGSSRRQSRRRARSSSTWSSREEGGEGPTPYEVLLHAALRATARGSRARTVSRRPGAIMQPLLDAPPPVHPYAPGSWGPEEADSLVAGYGRWYGPWIAS